MAIRVSQQDFEFAERVQGLCAAGKSESAIAEDMGVSRYGLTERLRGMGLGIQTRRQVIRLGTNEPLPQLVERKELAVASEEEPVAATA